MPEKGKETPESSGCGFHPRFLAQKTDPLFYLAMIAPSSAGEEKRSAADMRLGGLSMGQENCNFAIQSLV